MIKRLNMVDLVDLRFYCESRYLSERFNRLFRQNKYLPPCESKTWQTLLEGKYQKEIGVPGSTDDLLPGDAIPDDFLPGGEEAFPDHTGFFPDDISSNPLNNPFQPAADCDPPDETQFLTRKTRSGKVYLALPTPCSTSIIPDDKTSRPPKSIISASLPYVPPTTCEILSSCTRPLYKAYLRAFQAADMSENSRWFSTIHLKDLPVTTSRFTEEKSKLKKSHNKRVKFSDHSEVCHFILSPVEHVKARYPQRENKVTNQAIKIYSVSLDVSLYELQF